MRQNVCLITGGAGFLGQKYCELFLKNNYVVLCVDNNKKNLQSVKQVNSKNFFIYECDISSEKKVKNLFKKINKSFLVNVLINNAAIDAIPFKNKNRNQKRQVSSSTIKFCLLILSVGAVSKTMNI